MATLKEMTTVISENINLVSDKTREAFDKLPVEEKYKKIKKLIANKAFYDKKKSGAATVKKQFSFTAKLQDMFEKKGVTAEQLDEITAFCERYKAIIKDREIEKISAEIDRLTKMKEELSK